ncbi:hypothetical protein HBI79_049800 [Parastagonospora nodorum]|nr:hypothetical protein HBI79_049800 [Parastagonospora nodorum]
MKLFMITLIIAMASTVFANDPKSKPEPDCTLKAQKCDGNLLVTCHKFVNKHIWVPERVCKECTGGDKEPVCYF